MDPISTLNQAMAVLRQQLAQQARRGERSASSGDKAARDGGAVASSSASANADVGASIRARVSELRAAGVEDEAQLSRVVVEMLLRREFGSAMVNDSEFQRMVTWVQQGVEEDEGGKVLLRNVVGM
ncbi:hypothetical protein FAZ69_10975 [Trinickia terrae]|uniref:Uncharacterized protein n=1 Tax=Trinickia terrae TaxID=2571161 RepID=A0A4V5PJ01_9BURK|nr:hypothetical protein [Trinickia terrae]TKC89450.1 hypothetical protein FAZ69_10975 [Trinickia terrae]